MDVFPDFGAVAGSGQLQAVVGALLMIVLVLAVAMLIVCAVGWALSASHGNYHTAAKARAGLLVSLGTAALAGAGVAWMNFLLDIGTRL
jgi:steroid 5-alpha reductase family enzyme